MMKPRTPTFWLIIFLAMVSLLRLAFIGKIPVTPDETYYWSWSTRPDLAYFDQPGMVAWIGWLANHLPHAPTVFTIRLPAVIIMALATLFAYACYQKLFDDQTEAILLAIAFNFTPIFFSLGIATIHDTALILFLTGFYWAAARLIKTPSPATLRSPALSGTLRSTSANWTILSLFLLGALYSKLNAAIIALSFTLYIFISPFGRSQLRKPWVWISGLVCALGFLPVIAWNQQRAWPQLLATSQLVKKNGLDPGKIIETCAEYVVSQFGVYSPLIMLGMIAAIFAAVKHYRKTRDQRMLLLLTLSLPALFYFPLQSLRSPVFANWSLIAYFPLLVLFTRFSFDGFGKGKILNNSFWKAAVALAIIISVATLVETRFRLTRPLAWMVKDKLKLERPLDWRLDQEFEAWDQLKNFLDNNRMPEEKLSSRRYQIASLMQFLLSDHPTPVVVPGGFKLSQYSLWTSPEELRQKSAIYVDTSPMPERIRKCFAQVQDLQAPLNVHRRGRLVKKFYIYRVYDYLSCP